MKRELVITVDGRERTVVVDGPQADGRFAVAIDGEQMTVDAQPIRAGTWSLMIAGRQFVVDLDKRRTGVAASTGASEAILQVEDARARKLAAATGGARGAAGRGESIHAPIAGKVIKALVAVGEVVAAGQAVFVLEAMKMENELVAERGGTVSAVHRQAGKAVEAGDLLVEMT